MAAHVVTVDGIAGWCFANARAEDAFVDEVIELLTEGDVDEISANNLADGWGMHPSTVRTWLYRAWENGALDRRRAGRNYLYRVSDKRPTPA